MQNRYFKYIDDWATIRLADSFVKTNKSGSGNGEAALYLGTKFDPDIFRFFGEENFDVHCITLKSDFVEYMEDVKDEYFHHRFNYRNEVSMNTWKRYMEEIEALPNEMHFDLTRKRQFDKRGRVYAQELTYKGYSRSLSIEVNHKAFIYDIFRKIAIPEVSFIMLTKLEDDLLDFHAKLYYDPNNI